MTLLTVAVPLTVRLEPAPVRTREPVMVSPVLRTFSDEAPVKFAVIVVAEKLPEESRCTALLAILALLNSMLPSFHTF